MHVHTNKQIETLLSILCSIEVRFCLQLSVAACFCAQLRILLREYSTVWVRALRVVHKLNAILKLGLPNLWSRFIEAFLIVKFCYGALGGTRKEKLKGSASFRRRSLRSGGCSLIPLIDNSKRFYQHARKSCKLWNQHS